ncbi:YcjX family protein, partial [Bacillus cereus group sp. Bce020]
MSALLHRGLDAHVRLAVTGLSRAGKTAFISSLVNQLLHTATHDQLPLLAAARDKRIIGAKRIPQSNLMVPRFSYDQAMEQLHADPPN